MLIEITTNGFVAEPVLALAATLAFALAFPAGCAGCPGCFWCPGALPEFPGDAGGPCPLPAIAVPASAARTSARPSAITALRRFIFASPLLRTTAYVEGHVDPTVLTDGSALKPRLALSLATWRRSASGAPRRAARGGRPRPRRTESAPATGR